VAIVLSLKLITKNYGKLRALNNVSFDVPESCVFGVLGPNGSGKTTLLGIVMDVLKAGSGDFSWFGKPGTNEQRKSIGTLLETPNFYHYLSGRHNLEIAAAIKGRGKEDIPAVLKQVNLEQRQHSKFSTYSLGMKQRLAIAAALLGNPPVLVLDEPTNGLDPMGISEIRDLIRQLAAQGKTIIMASHLLDEVEKVCTHVAILKKGNLLMAGPVDEVLINEDVVEIGAADLSILENILRDMAGVKSVKPGNRILQVQLTEPVGLETINQYCYNKGIVLNHLMLRRRSLESKFMELTNEGGPQLN
jgi:ABC-type multidrug transport system ATPase subunit